MTPPPSRRVLGRYELHAEIGSGGMATVRLGRLLGPMGFSRTVAIKELHARFSKDLTFVSMFLDEARLASRVRHPNVVPIVDVGSEGGELFLVMEYVHGETLAELIPKAASSGGIPPPVVVSVLAGALRGLHAAHEAKGENGAALHLVHRDFSPQNVLVGSDGLARVLDFGIAKATGRLHTTRDGSRKGKLGYMASEHLLGAPLDRRADVFAAGVVLWEALAGRRLFDGIDRPSVTPPSALVAGVPAALDAVVARAMASDKGDRFATADEMARALEDALAPATQGKVADYLASVAKASLGAKSMLVAELESGGGSVPVQTQSAAPPVALFAAAKGAQPVATTMIDDTRVDATAEPIVLPVSRGHGRAIAVAGVGLAIGAAIALVWRQSHVEVPPPAPAAPVTASASVAVSAAPPVTAMPAMSVAPIVSASAAPKATAIKRSCTPPYWEDERGIRHPKPECL